MWGARRVLVAAVSLMAVACGQPDDGEPARVTEEQAAHPDVIWFDVLAVSKQADMADHIALAQDLDALTALWERHRFDGEPPTVDFAERVVVVLARAEDACPDDLVEVRMVDAVVDFTWLPPPGACNQPLIPTGYAVALHRADLPESLTVTLREHPGHGGDKQETFTLPVYAGPPAPVPSPPPRQMSQAEVDAVFAGHALRRCDEMPDFHTPPRIDGPVSPDPEVAELQRRRAEFALPSDEATARRLLEASDVNTAMGFAMTEAEFEELIARNRPEFSAQVQERYLSQHGDTYGFSLVDQADGGTWVVGFTADVEGHRRRLAEMFPDVPIRVVEAAATAAQLDEEQKQLMPFYGRSTRPQVLGSGSGGPWLRIQLLDPRRDDLDALAAVVDPSLACVEVTRSGLRPE